MKNRLLPVADDASISVHGQTLQQLNMAINNNFDYLNSVGLRGLTVSECRKNLFDNYIYLSKTTRFDR